MADVTRASIDSGNYDQVYIQNKAIKTLEKTLVFGNYVTPGELPANEGSTLRWTIDDNFSATTAFTALTSGAANYDYADRDNINVETFDGSTVSKQIHAYGAFVPIRNTDLRDLPRGMMDRIGDRLGYRGREVFDILMRAVVDGSGNAAPFNPTLGTGTSNTRVSIRAANNATLETGDLLTLEDLALATGDLWAVDAMPFSNGRYAAIIHSTAAIHVATDVSTARLTWESIHKFVSGFSGQEVIVNGTMGGILGTDIIRTNNITTATVDTTPAYENIVLSMDAIGNVRADDATPQVFINTPDKSSTDNPYRMWGTASFFFKAGPALIDENRCVLLHSAQ